MRDAGGGLVAQPPARGVQAQHEVDVLGDVHALVEPRSHGCAADEQGRARDVGDAGARDDQRRVRAEVERRAHGLVAAQPARDRRQRDDARRDEPDGRVRQARQQRLAASRARARRRSRGTPPAGCAAAASPALRAAAGPRGVGWRSTAAPARSATARTAAGSADPSSTTITRRPAALAPARRRFADPACTSAEAAAPATGRTGLRRERAFAAAANPAHVDLERGEEAGEAVGAVLHRDHHRDVRRRGHGVGGLGDRVRDPGVEQAAGERGRRRVGDGEPALDQPVGRGGRQVQHPRRRPAQQHRAVVEHAGAALQHDGRAVRDGGAVGPGAHPAHTRPPPPSGESPFR